MNSRSCYEFYEWVYYYVRGVRRKLLYPKILYNYQKE